MKKYDITQKVEFRTGTYNLNQDANFNFQLNRVIMWDGGDPEEIAGISHRINSSEIWVKALEYLAKKAHAEGRTGTHSKDR